MSAALVMTNHDDILGPMLQERLVSQTTRSLSASYDSAFTSPRVLHIYIYIYK